MQKFSAHTFMLVKCMMHLRNAETYARTISREPSVTGQSRQTMNRIADRAAAAVREFMDPRIISQESLRIIQQEILPDEVCLQLEAITDLILAMPKEQRDMVEEYANSLKNSQAVVHE